MKTIKMKITTEEKPSWLSVAGSDDELQQEGNNIPNLCRRHLFHKGVFATLNWQQGNRNLKNIFRFPAETIAGALLSPDAMLHVMVAFMATPSTTLASEVSWQGQQCLASHPDNKRSCCPDKRFHDWSRRWTSCHTQQRTTEGAEPSHLVKIQRGPCSDNKPGDHGDKQTNKTFGPCESWGQLAEVHQWEQASVCLFETCKVLLCCCCCCCFIGSSPVWTRTDDP